MVIRWVPVSKGVVPRWFTGERDASNVIQKFLSIETLCFVSVTNMASSHIKNTLLFEKRQTTTDVNIPVKTNPDRAILTISDEFGFRKFTKLRC